jgi:drug/metabolite transporter (DMT)-like permease
LTTALFAVLRVGERPPAAFWGFASLGALCVMLFAASRASGAEATGDALMAATVLSAGLGYAEGGRLAREMSGWRVVSWALALALPISLPLAVWLRPAIWPPIGAPGWPGLAYVSLLSMWIGFVFWYRGLALGGIAAVGQLQLLQPFFGLLIAGLVLRESVSPATFVTAGAVLVCVFAARRASAPARPAAIRR